VSIASEHSVDQKTVICFSEDFSEVVSEFVNILVGMGVRKHCCKKSLTQPEISAEPNVLDGTMLL
jgi:hypothetical protein